MLAKNLLFTCCKFGADMSLVGRSPLYFIGMCGVVILICTKDMNDKGLHTLEKSYTSMMTDRAIQSKYVMAYMYIHGFLHLL